MSEAKHTLRAFCDGQSNDVLNADGTHAASEVESPELAELFAAAPELLEACKAALAQHEAGQSDPAIFDVVRAAIAKATGATK